MTILSKMRLFFAINILLLIIFRIVIPGYKEIKRQKEVTANTINKYKNNSTIIKVPNYEKLLKEDKNEIYFDGTPFVKKYSTKEISLIKDKTAGKIYKLELYYPQSFIDIGKNDESFWLAVNNNELKNKKGTANDPIIVLQYGFGPIKNSYIPQEKYDYSIKEYLTYKDYTVPSKDLIYYLNMIWVFVTIAGFSITTGMSIRKDRAEKKEAESSVMMNAKE